MKKIFYYLSISIILTTISYSKNVFSKSLDSDATIDGRWGGITLCKWDIENWGGGEYELGNGKFSAVLDFSIITENGEKKLKGKRFVNFGDRASKILSYKIEKKTLSVEDQSPWDDESYTWKGKLITDNRIEFKNNNGCKSTVYRTEEISFDSYSPRNLLDYVDGVENDEQYTIPGM